jgi:hypothetical protein
MTINRRQFIGWLLPFGLIAGCASTRPATRVAVQSRIQDGYDARLTRLIVLTPLQPPGNEPNIWPAIVEDLKSKGVSCEPYPVDPLALDRESKLQQAISRLAADHILIIGKAASAQQTRSSINGSLSKGAAIYDASLLTAANRQTIWRAQLKVTYLSLMAQEDLEGEISAALIARLVSDGLLGPANS